MKKLTDEEVLLAWQNAQADNGHFDSVPTPLDLKRMRGTLLKRAERARKKGLTPVGAPVDVQIVNAGTPAPTLEWVQPNENRPAFAGIDLAAKVDVPPMTFPVKKRFTIVPVLSDGHPLADVVVDAISTEEANSKVMAGLSNAQRDACEYLDIKSVEDICVACGTSPAKLHVASSQRFAEGSPICEKCMGHPPTADADEVAAFHKLAASPMAKAIGIPPLGPVLSKEAPVLTAPETINQNQPKEDEVKKNKSTKKTGKRVAREDIVKSAAFIALFDKAIANSRDPKRTHCKNGHTITAAHAHVGDLKRTGRYTCDPCNTEAQARYAASK